MTPALPRMNVLLIGSGGREHALAMAVVDSEHCKKLFCAPGNAGIAEVATCLPADVMDNAAVVKLCRDNAIDLVIVAPDDPLANGLVDALQNANIPTFGPRQNAAQIESSKAFAKTVCDLAHTPTAEHATFTDADSARAYIRQKGVPIVIKADGLMRGKGVCVAQTLAEADAFIVWLSIQNAFAPGKSILVEEFMEGEELSFFTLHDGTGTIHYYGHAQDHKRVFDGDKGPNTGGMGSYSPVPWFSDTDKQTILNTIVRPVDDAMRNMGRPFSGFLYTGLKRIPQPNGVFKYKVVEFNARMGDPEAQTILPLIEGDILPSLYLAAHKRLSETHQPLFHNAHALTVVVAAKGYPGNYDTGSALTHLKRAVDTKGALVFHAATTRDADGTFRADGGRVLAVTGVSQHSLADAHEAAYTAIENLDWPDGHHRTDIASRALTETPEIGR